MKKICVKSAITLFCFLCLVQISLAETWVLTEKKRKIKHLAQTSTGLEFALKGIYDLTPNSSCHNEFIILKDHENYNTLTAFLLTAYAKKKYVDLFFDNDSTDCQVTVDSVVLH